MVELYLKSPCVILYCLVMLIPCINCWMLLPAIAFAGLWENLTLHWLRTNLLKVLAIQPFIWLKIFGMGVAQSHIDIFENLALGHCNVLRKTLND